MKANLNELRELAYGLSDEYNALGYALQKLFFRIITEPLQVGEYVKFGRFEEIDLNFTNANLRELLIGFEYLEAIETDFTEEYEINL